jgi:glutathione synthase/RimK-type ligase-like ATP-grasp enzyme
MTVLILGSEDDEHATYMHGELARRGADAVLIDGALFPQAVTIAFDPGDGSGEIGLPGGRTVSFESVTSVYWRSYDGIGAADLPDHDQRDVAYNDSRGLFESMLIHLPARWVNSWDAVQLHQTKPVQLAMVARLGVPIPRSIITNAPQPLLRFANSNPRAIFKPVQGGAHTRRLTADLLTAANLENLKIAPVSIQEEIAGTNVRAFVIGDRVLGCEIPTTAVDFRDDDAQRVIPHRLSAEQQETCRVIARTLGLVWTGIDFRLTPDGRYVFLEANPSPMFLGFEELSGLPLTDALASLLLQSSEP